jgi:hypothetical protein
VPLRFIRRAVGEAASWVPGGRARHSHSAAPADRFAPMMGLDVLIHRYDFSYQPWLAWLPHPSAWIHLTGVGRLAAFFALLFGVLPRLAATMEAAMMWLIQDGIIPHRERNPKKQWDRD